MVVAVVEEEEEELEEEDDKVQKMDLMGEAALVDEVDLVVAA